jgi:hypothetical protein
MTPRKETELEALLFHAVDGLIDLLSRPAPVRKERAPLIKEPDYP